MGYAMTPDDVDESPTISSIQRRLRQRLDDLGTVHRAHIHERDDIESRLDTCVESIEKVGVLPAISNKLLKSSVIQKLLKFYDACLMSL